MEGGEKGKSRFLGRARPTPRAVPPGGGDMARMSVGAAGSLMKEIWETKKHNM